MAVTTLILNIILICFYLFVFNYNSQISRQHHCLRCFTRFTQVVVIRPQYRHFSVLTRNQQMIS